MLYAQHGVSSHKADLRHAIANVNKGLFPSAFCKIVPDILSNEKGYCCVMHADGAGTKSVIAYMLWKENGDINIFKGIAQDALVMNIDDILCVGAAEPILVSTTIGRNAKLIPRDVLKVLIESFEDLMIFFKKLGLSICTTGGETADLGDLVRTLVVDATVVCRMPRAKVIDLNNIETGDIIIGLASYGQTSYEKVYNSGIGSNGLTLARHVLLNKSYGTLFPESYDSSSTDTSDFYKGSYKLSDPLPGTELTIGEALLSPTRSFAPVLTTLFSSCPQLVLAVLYLVDSVVLNIKRGMLSDMLGFYVSILMVHGIVHCSGGGQTKCKNVIMGFRFVKNNLFPCPPIFKVIQQEGNIKWSEMYEVFNMGHRMEIFGPKELLPIVESFCQDYNLPCQQVGHVERIEGLSEVVIETSEGSFTY